MYENLCPMNSSTSYVDSVVKDNTDWDSGQENDHEASGLYCFIATTGKVKPVRLSVMVGCTDIVMEHDTEAPC